MNTQTSSTNWQLNDLFTGMDDAAINQAFTEADRLIETLKTYRGKIISLNSEALLELITTWEQVHRIYHRIDLFASLLESTSIGVAEVTRFRKNIDEQLVEKGKEIIFIEVELAQIPEVQWQKHLTANELKGYKQFLQEQYEASKHVLSEPEEKILADKSQTSWQALTHLFDITTDTLECNWDGTSVTLEELLTKFHSADGAERKKAAEVLHASLAKNDKTTPAIYNSLVQDKSIGDRLRKYDFPEQSRFMHDAVDKPTVEAMATAVEQSFDLVTRYYELKKKILKTDTLYWYDRYAPLPETKAKIGMHEAKTMVEHAYRDFSPAMADIVQNMYDKEHIDWLPQKTKRGGAFCAFGDTNIYPYVLLNHTDSPRDVMTLAHELGHAIHDVLAGQNNVFLEIHPSLALAEIASVFGETLLFEKLVADPKINKDDKLTLLMAHIEGTFATVFRQTTMFRFEQKVHELRRKEGELSKEEIDTLWHETMQAPFEKALTYTDEHKNTWMYVSHIFEMPFYVYSYSFAQLCVLALYKQYKEQGSAFVPTYLEILKAGGSLSPKENLARAGLNISQPEFWKGGLAVIDEFIKQLEKEIN